MSRIYRVDDLMTVGPITVNVDTTLREVLQRMRQDDCRQLPVLDESDKLVGIITDRDVRLSLNSPLVLHERWQDEELMDTVTAGGLMTADPITVAPQTLAYEAAEILSTHKFGALPVVAGDALVGIISVTDFLNRFATDQRQLADVEQDQ